MRAGWGGPRSPRGFLRLHKARLSLKDSDGSCRAFAKGSADNRPYESREGLGFGISSSTREVTPLCGGAPKRCAFTGSQP